MGGPEQLRWEERLRELGLLSLEAAGILAVPVNPRGEDRAGPRGTGHEAGPGRCPLTAGKRLCALAVAELAQERLRGLLLGDQKPLGPHPGNPALGTPAVAGAGAASFSTILWYFEGL